jgi:hypothetical protein
MLRTVSSPNCNDFITLPSVRVEDTWDGVYGNLTSDGESLDDPLDEVIMTFTDSSGAEVLVLDTDGGAVITNAADWEWLISARTPIGLPKGIYNWKIQFINDQGRAITYIQGSIQLV